MRFICAFLLLGFASAFLFFGCISDIPGKELPTSNYRSSKSAEVPNQVIADKTTESRPIKNLSTAISSNGTDLPSPNDKIGDFQQKPKLFEWTYLVAKSGNESQKTGYGNMVSDLANAGLYNPRALAFAPDGNLYVADALRIRRINLSQNKIYYVAGGWDDLVEESLEGVNGHVKLSQPQGLAFGPDGYLYISDTLDGRILKLDLTYRNVTLVAGKKHVVGTNYSYAEGVRDNASFSQPGGIAFGPDGYLYVADAKNNRIRKINVSDGRTFLVAGSGKEGFSDGNLLDASFTSPQTVAFDSDGFLYVSESYDCIRKINLKFGKVSKLAGRCGGFGNESQFSTIYYPRDLVFGQDGMLYVGQICDIAKINTSSGSASLLTGTGRFSGPDCGYVEGNVSWAMFNISFGISFDQDGMLYVADSNNQRIRRIGPAADYLEESSKKVDSYSEFRKVIAKRATKYFVNYTITSTTFDLDGYGYRPSAYYQVPEGDGLVSMQDFAEVIVWGANDLRAKLKYPYRMKTSTIWEADYRLGYDFRRDYFDLDTFARRIDTGNLTETCYSKYPEPGWNCHNLTYENGRNPNVNSLISDDNFFQQLAVDPEPSNVVEVKNEFVPETEAYCFKASGFFNMDAMLTENRTYCFSRDGVLVYYKTVYIEWNKARTASRLSGERTIMNATSFSTSVDGQVFSQEIFTFKAEAPYNCISDASVAPGMSCIDYCRSIEKSCSPICKYEGFEGLLENGRGAGIGYPNDRCETEVGTMYASECSAPDLWKFKSFKCCCN